MIFYMLLLFCILENVYIKHEHIFYFILIQALNKRGQVLSVDDNGNVEVLVETQPWTFHPCALALVSSSEKETGMEDEREGLFRLVSI